VGRLSYPTLAAAEADGCFRASKLAQLLGTSRQQVHTWSVRRGRNGFPSPAGDCLGTNVYRLTDVEYWLTMYVPSRGGAPKKVAATC
jgi:hypothetical protein